MVLIPRPESELGMIHAFKSLLLHYMILHVLLGC